MRNKSQHCLCIPTYKRSQFLEALLRDVLAQSVLPAVVIVVDGDPASGQALQILHDIHFPENMRICFIPSNHANLPYQRYLGWLAAEGTACEYIVFLDDDLRIAQFDAIEKVMQPFWNDETVVGVTAKIEEVQVKRKPVTMEATCEQNAQLPTWFKKLVQQWGSSRRVRPGQLTASGHRLSVEYRGNSYERVEWLYGRVMAYSMRALTQDSFSHDLFAMYHLKCGKAEDTFLSHRVSKNGKMLHAFNATFNHSAEAIPNAYPIQPYRMAYAIAYSRRLLNDNVCSTGSFHFSGWLALAISYIGNVTLEWYRVVSGFNSARLKYALGYTAGALRGLFQRPTAIQLTPNINWWVDAEEAFSRLVIVQ